MGVALAATFGGPQLARAQFDEPIGEPEGDEGVAGDDGEPSATADAGGEAAQDTDEAPEPAEERVAVDERPEPLAEQRSPALAPPAGDPSDPAYYRGRSNPSPPEDALLWIPRVLFAPITLITELVIHLPLNAFFEWAVRNHIFDGIDELLHPHPDVSWTPTVSFTAGVIALPGIRGAWRNALYPGHEVDASFAMAASDFWTAAVHDEWHFGPFYFGASGSGTDRPERPFYGLGPDSGDQRTYFRLKQVDAYGYLGLIFGLHANARVSFGYSREDVGPGISPSVDTRVPLNEIPGFRLYELGIGAVDLTLDSREHLEDNGGVRFVGNTTFGLDARNPSGSFMTVALDLEAGVEVSAPDRVLVGRVYLMNTLPFGDSPVPFTRLAWLGYDRHRGFVIGRFRGEAALLVEARYRYPVNYYADLQWIASVGNVFARDASDFSFGALTGSFGVGVRTRRTGMTPLDISLAFGTSRFDAAAFSVQSIRVYFESTYGL